MNKISIFSIIGRVIGFIGVLAMATFIVCYFNEPKYLWLLCLLIFTEIPIYEIKYKDDKEK